MDSTGNYPYNPFMEFTLKVAFVLKSLKQFLGPKLD